MADKDQRIIEIILKAQDANASLKEMGAGAAVMTAQLSRMGQDDPGRAKLLGDLQLLNARVQDGRAALRARAQTAEEAAAQEAAAARELAAAEAQATEAIAEQARANEQTVATGKQATASLNEMKAAASLVEKELSAMGADDPGRAALQRDFTVLNQRIGEATTAMRTHVKTEAELAQEAQALAEAEARVAAEQVKVVVDGKKVNATFNEMTAAAKQLEKELHELSADDPGRRQLLHDYQALGKRIEEAKTEMGGAKQEGSLLTQALAFGGITVGAEAVLEGVKELGAEIINTTKEVEALRSSINTMTGATGSELDGLTTSVLAISRSFGKDFNEVLLASNTLSKQMGVSQQEALRLVQQGFLAGADAGEDFLDQVKEYAPQFKAAGASADEFIGHIANASNQGIFSDKGADVVKEFGLRIKEQTKSTTDAMQAAFGSDFTTRIFGGIKDGSLTVMQALQQVAKEMDETKIPANQLQTVIADVFGGPGEDAGIAYLKSLKSVGKGVDEMVDKTNVYTQRQQALLDSNHELGEAQNALTREFEGSGNVWQTLANQGMTVLYTLLVSLAATFKEMFAPVQQLWQSLTELGVKMGWLSEKGITAKDVGNALGAVFRLLNTGSRLLIAGLSWLVTTTADWVKGNEAARVGLEALTFPLRTTYELLRNAPAYVAGFTAAFKAGIDSVGRAWELLKGGDLAGASVAFGDQGKNAARAFKDAFNAAMAEKASSSASSANAGDENQPTRTQGGDGLTDADRAKAKKAASDKAAKDAREAKAAQDKADKEYMESRKAFYKEEAGLLQGSSELERMRHEAANTDELKRRELQRRKIIDDADKKYNALLLMEGDHTLEMSALIEERDLALREQQKAWDEKDKEERLKKLDEKLADDEASEAVEVAALDAKRASGLLNESQYQDQLYDITKQGLERRLALLIKAGQGETAEAKKIQAAILKANGEHIGRQKAQEQQKLEFEQNMAKQAARLLVEGLEVVEENLDKRSEAYQVFKAARKAAAIAEVGINLISEIQNNALWYSDPRNPLQSIPGAALAEMIIKDGLALVRAAGATTKIAAFATGGRTDKPNALLAPWLGTIADRMAPTGSFAPGGPVDKATIGLIGEAGPELVIPNWMYADPKQANLMGFLEAQIASRGNAFAVGGSTTGSSPVQAAGDGSDLGRLIGLMEQLVRGQQEFRDEITDWQRGLEVNLDPRKAKKAIDVATQVQSGGGIR